MPRSIKTPQTRRSLKAKGLNTRAAILEKAQEVFRDLGYYQTSVSEITRRCGVSSGTFYQYFKSKEEIFLELNDLIIARFWEQAEALPPGARNLKERLTQAVQLLYDHLSSYFYFHRILGEFELIESVTIGYYDSIARYYRNFLRQEAGLGAIRPFDPNLITYGLIGMVYFNTLDWGSKSETYPPDKLVSLTVDLILRGISGSKPWNRPGDHDGFFGDGEDRWAAGSGGGGRPGSDDQAGTFPGRRNRVRAVRFQPGHYFRDYPFGWSRPGDLLYSF